MKIKMLGLPFLGFLGLVLSLTAGAADWQRFGGFYVNSEHSPLISMIAAAQQSIDIEIYTMKDPVVTRELLLALKRKVKVRIIQDPSPFAGGGMGCQPFSEPASSDDIDCQKSKLFMKAALSYGAVYVPFNKAELCPLTDKAPSCFEHGKLLIADGKAALISSGNFDRSNLCHPSSADFICNRDYTVVTVDQAAIKALKAVFEKDLLGKRYDVRSVIPASLQNKLTVSPYSLEPLVRFIGSARESVVVQNQYLNDPTLNDALMAAAKRGIKVFVNVSSVCAFGPPDDRKKEVTTDVYSKFDAAGVKSSFFTDSIRVGHQPGYLHAKAIVVDSKVAWMGSVNGSTNALSRNREFGLFFSNPSWVRTLYSTIEADFYAPGAETWQESLECKKDKRVKR